MKIITTDYERIWKNSRRNKHKGTEVINVSVVAACFYENKR